MTKLRKTRKTLRETVAENQATLAFYAKCAGKEFVPKVTFEPVKKRAPAVYSGPSESDIQKTILAYLRVHSGVAWRMRVNSGMFAEGDRFIQANSQRGCSDIIGMLKGGRCFAIEVKSAKGRVSPQQQEFLDLIAAGGGLSGVARSIEDVDTILRLHPYA